jgi:plastocyanin
MTVREKHHGLSSLPRLILLACSQCCVFPVALAADQGAVPVVAVTLGDYAFEPAEIRLKAGQPVILELKNTDRITPHNLTLDDEAAGLSIDLDVSGGKTARVELTPTVPGTYTFYCNKKLPFMKSHREHGMEGHLIVTP